MAGAHVVMTLTLFAHCVCRPSDAKGKGGKKGDKGGGDDSGRPLVAPLTLQSPHLDLQSPAGMYR
jgi:hypothetical protein